MVFSRRHLLCLLFLAVVMPARAQELKWHFSTAELPSAESTADDTRKRLLVCVQFHRDFTQDLVGSPEIRFFEHSGLKNGNTRDWFAKHTRLLAQPVGTPQVFLSMSEQETLEASRQLNNCVCWFCLPDGRVVHLLVGYPDEETLLHAAQWAHEIMESIADKTALASGSVVEHAHWSKTSLEDRRVFLSFLDETTKLGKELTDVSPWLPAVVAAAQTRNGRLMERFGLELNEIQKNNFLFALAEHAAFENDAVNLLLAKTPMVQRAEIAPLVWRHFTGLKPWDESHSDIASWTRRQIQRRRPLLLRIVHSDFPVIDVDESQWLSEHTRRTQASARSFAVRSCSMGELALVANELGLRSIELLGARSPVAFFISDHRGHQTRILTASDKSSELLLALDSIK